MADLRSLRRLLRRTLMMELDLWRMARATLQPGTKIDYVLASRKYSGEVIEVIGFAGSFRIRVENIKTKKQRDVRLDCIVGSQEL